MLQGVEGYTAKTEGRVVPQFPRSVRMGRLMEGDCDQDGNDPRRGWIDDVRKIQVRVLLARHADEQTLGRSTPARPARLRLYGISEQYRIRCNPGDGLQPSYRLPDPSRERSL